MISKDKGLPYAGMGKTFVSNGETPREEAGFRRKTNEGLRGHALCRLLRRTIHFAM